MRRWFVPVVTVGFAALLAGGSLALAADSPAGTWVKKPTAGGIEMTLKIDSWGRDKAKLVWTFKGKGMDGTSMTVVSGLDGRDAPVMVNGKDSGQTMAITVVDRFHSSTVVKMQGKPFGTSKATFSPDFKTMTVENDFVAAVGGNPAGKTTEVWARK